MNKIVELICCSVFVSFSTLAHGIYVLSVDTLIKEALNAYQNGEEVSQM